MILDLQEMEKLVKSGRIRAIGISNFNESQIIKIIENAEIMPSNLQVIYIKYLSNDKNHQLFSFFRLNYMHTINKKN